MGKEKYDKEFKENALKMAERDGTRKTCEKLGIRKHNIYEWRRKKRLENGGLSDKRLREMMPGESLEDAYHRVCDERDEIAEANYILKKALGFFVDR